MRGCLSLCACGLSPLFPARREIRTARSSQIPPGVPGGRGALGAGLERRRGGIRDVGHPANPWGAPEPPPTRYLRGLAAFAATAAASPRPFGRARHGILLELGMRCLPQLRVARFGGGEGRERGNEGAYALGCDIEPCALEARAGLKPPRLCVCATVHGLVAFMTWGHCVTQQVGVGHCISSEGLEKARRPC